MAGSDLTARRLILGKGAGGTLPSEVLGLIAALLGVMNTRTALTIIVNTLVTLTMIPMAVAQPSLTPISQPEEPTKLEEPTKSKPKPKVSQINGQLAKVGEHNDYYYDYKRFNVSINPIELIQGNFAVSASYGFNNHIALRGNLTIFLNLFEEENSTSGIDNRDGVEVGLSAPLYLRRTYQGIFVEPGVVIRKFEYNETFGPQILLGYHATWDSGFNFSLAMGLGRGLVTKSNEQFKDGEFFFSTYLRVGYAF